MPDVTAGAEVLAIDHPDSGYAFDTTFLENLVNTTFQPASPVVSTEIDGPTSGQVLVVVGGSARAADKTHMGCRLREDDSSGLIVEQAQVTEHGFGSAPSTSNWQWGCRVSMYESLAQGQHYYAEHMVRAPQGGGGTGDVGERTLALIPLPLYVAQARPGAPYIGTEGEAGDFARALPRAAFANSTESQLNLTNLDPDYQAGNPEVGVVFRAPPSGKVLVAVGGGGRDNGAADSRVFLTIEVFEGHDDRIGLATVEADSESFFRHGWASSGQTSEYMYSSRVSLLEDLEPGETYYARVMHSVEAVVSEGPPAVGSADLTVREIAVVPVPEGAVSAFTDTTVANISSATFTSDANSPAVSFEVPPSGKVLVSVGGGGRDNSANANRAMVAPQIWAGDDTSGDVLLAADVEEHGWSSFGESSAYMYGSRVSVIDLVDLGASPGDTCHVVTMHCAQDGTGNADGSADLSVRDVVVVPIT